VKDLLFFLAFLPLYLVALVTSGVAIAVLFVAGVVYVPARMMWALVTGRDLGPGW